ncbi:hypothetical protein Tco_0453056 [Tanacetum coccineum]
MTTLADKSLLSGGDNKPPMLEKHLYDSWNSRIELYMLNKPHGRMILASVEKGPLVWPLIIEDGVTRLKEYIELTPAEAIQADCDIKVINIILQGLPTEIYGSRSQTSECKRSLGEIKLPNARNDLHTTNVDQLHAYLQQHERHANEVRLMHELETNYLKLLEQQENTTLEASGNNTGKQQTVIVTNSKGEVILSNSALKPKEMDETWSMNKVLQVQFKQVVKFKTRGRNSIFAKSRTNLHSDCGELNSAQEMLLLRIFLENGSDALTEIQKLKITSGLAISFLILIS